MGKKHFLKVGACTSLGFFSHTVVSCNSRDEIDEGYRFGKISVQIYDVFKTEAWLSRTTAAFYGCIYTWKNPVQAGLEPLRRGYHVGIETGDIEYAMVRLFVFGIRVATAGQKCT